MWHWLRLWLFFSSIHSASSLNNPYQERYSKDISETMSRLSCCRFKTCRNCRTSFEWRRWWDEWKSHWGLANQISMNLCEDNPRHTRSIWWLHRCSALGDKFWYRTCVYCIASDSWCIFEWYKYGHFFADWAFFESITHFWKQKYRCLDYCSILALLSI